MNLKFTLELFDIINILLLIGFIGFGIYYFSNIWHKNIPKPYKWETAVENQEISKELLDFEKVYFDKIRLYNLWLQIKRLQENKIEGAFAEVGVYKGETAKIIHHSDVSRELFLFDTFTGFNNNDLELENNTDKKYNIKNFSDTSSKEVDMFINSTNDNLKYVKGYFPDTLTKEHDIAYALVNLDADLYKPTKDSLDYFYPRLSKSGVIIVHDYNHTWDGNRKAVDDFISENKGLSISEVPDAKGSIMIFKS